MSFKDKLDYLRKYVFLPVEIKKELSQRNYSCFRYINWVLIAFGLINETIYLIYCLSSGTFELQRVFYFAALVIVSFLMLIFNQIVKNAKSKRAYILKALPSYVAFFLALIYSMYNFFAFDNEFTGYLVYLIVTTLSIVLYNYEPIHQTVFQLFPLVLMGPKLYEKFQLFGMIDIFIVYLITLALCVYKRILIVKNADLEKNQIKDIKVITFGNFSLFYKDKIVKFQRRKSLELLAYLIFKKGSCVNSQELMTVLWGERATSSIYGANLRNSIVDIKHTLKETNIENFFICEYNSFRINPYIIDCDFYKFIEGNEEAKNSFTGEFMNQYEWGSETISYLEKLKYTNS